MSRREPVGIEMKIQSENRSQSQTIVAISTPPGIGGVGVIRISGPKSLDIAKSIFHPVSSSDWKSQHLYYGHIRHTETDEVMDDGYAVFFHGPHTFTGEDVVEFQLHGNPILLSDIVNQCLLHGARLATPGEFTKRAYLNGKMDLLQAEAVAELIHSQSLAEAHQARLRLDGKLSNHLSILREEVIDVLAEIEADVDFPEEEIDLQTQSKLLGRIEHIKATAQKFLQTYEQNQKINSGFRVVLVGRPNVGKSSIFNALLQTDRAIVTPIAGTTRDVLSEEIILDGYRVKLLDTAGLRAEFSDEIEKEGIARSGSEIAKADLVIWIGSTIEKYHESDFDVFEHVPRNKRWLVWNKCDLQQPEQTFHTFSEKQFLVSAQTHQNIDVIVDELKKILQENAQTDMGGGISNDRQRELLVRVVRFCEKTIELAHQKSSPELTAVEFREVYQALNRLLGKEDNMEDVYDRIFSKFCIGK